MGSDGAAERGHRVMSFSPNRHGIATPGWGEAQCDPAVRKKPRFTHGRGYFSGDVSGKRFNTHVVERNVAGVARGSGTAV